VTEFGRLDFIRGEEGSKPLRDSGLKILVMREVWLVVNLILGPIQRSAINLSY